MNPVMLTPVDGINARKSMEHHIETGNPERYSLARKFAILYKENIQDLPEHLE